jgi:hypothetical protein
MTVKSIILMPMHLSPKAFNQFTSRKRGVSIRHCFPDFVSHQPCGSVLPDIKKALHFCYTHSNFIHRHMIDHPIPFYQRRPGSMKNCACYHTCLKSTIFTIEQMPFGMIPGFSVTALRADISIWPALFSNVLCTGLIIWKFFLKLNRAALFIILGHLVTCSRKYLKSY